jgi:hypothetical protein
MIDHRGVFLIGLVLGAGVVGATACAGPEAGTVSFGEAASESTTGSKSGSGSTGGTKAAAPATTEPKDRIFGDEAFKGGTPAGGPAKNKAEHSVVNAAKDPSGIDCMTCHVATAPFAFAGTLYTDKTGTARVAGAEIRVTGPDGTAYATALSDADGNFWVTAPAGAIPQGSHVGVRTKDKAAEMVTAVSGAAGAQCSSASCHGTASMRVFLN